MKLAPERLEVEITYRIPEPVMNGLVAGGALRSGKEDQAPRPGRRKSASG